MTTRLASPFRTYLEVLYNDLLGLSEGEVADYIPELANAAPESFGISFATIDGQVYSVGDCRTEFTIQSVSKPFVYAGALSRLGAERVLQKVGVEPTGEAFNSIVLDERRNRPFNPMVNAGAIAIAALADGATQDDRVAEMKALFSRFAGRALQVDQAVYRSESETGHRNRAIAYLMLNSGMIDRAPEEVLDLYFQQCSVQVTTEDLALMGATLANGGVNPRTGERLLGAEEVRDVLTLMLTCGMYDYAGEWSYEVGLPAKSGVSGGILAILPGQLSVAIWSPPLDSIGNSVRGIEACRRISRDFGLHLFLNAAPVEDVVRRVASGRTEQSKRIRNPRDRDLLVEHGDRIALAELQGALYFASAERLIREMENVSSSEFLLLDFRRLTSMDMAAQRFFSDFLARWKASGTQIIFAEVPLQRPEVAAALLALAKSHDLTVSSSLDAALEASENAILAELAQPYDFTSFALASIPLFEGLDRSELAILEAMIQAVQFADGETIMAEGEEGDQLCVVARGTVGVWIGSDGGGKVRVGGLGPGQFFGEFAAFGGGPRLADVRADDRVVCYALTREQIDALGQLHPRIMVKILSNMTREFGARLRQANDQIGALK